MYDDNIYIYIQYGWTAVMVACKNGHLNIILMLLERQADIGVSTEVI